ncbi:hypothetical protein TKK_0018262 [Trichogramma kaykai]
MKNWERFSEFFEWIEKSDKAGKVCCKYCKRDLAARSDYLRKHAEKPIHKNQVNLATGNNESLNNKCKKIRPSRNVQNINEWKNLTNFSEWLVISDDDESKAFCLFCNQPLCARTDALRLHSTTRKHRVNEVYADPSKLTELEKNVIIGEITLSAMIATSNAPYLFMDTLIPVLKRILPDSAIMQKISLNRYKSNEIVNRVLAPEQKKIQSLLQNQSWEKFKNPYGT